MGATLPDNVVDRLAVNQPPQWAVSTPPSVVDRSAVAFAAPPWTNLDQKQLDAMRQKLLESIWQVLVQYFTGGLLPGPAGPQLQNWSNTLGSAGAWVTRLVNDLLITADVFHLIYNVGSTTDPPGTLGVGGVGPGKPTWYSAWNDLLALSGLVNSTAPPTDPAPSLGTSVTNALAWVTRVVNALLVTSDVFHVVYNVGAVGDPPGTLGVGGVGPGKPTWYSAWNDLLVLTGQVNSTSPPTDPAPRVNTAINTANNNAMDVGNFISNAITGGNAPTTIGSPMAFLAGLLGFIPHSNIIIPPSPGTGLITHDAGSAAVPFHGSATSTVILGASGTGAWNITLAAAADYLTVRVGHVSVLAPTVSAWYGSNGMQLLEQQVAPDGITWTHIFGMANPPTGVSTTLEVDIYGSFGLVQTAAAQADSYIGVGSIGVVLGASGTNSSPAITIASVVNNYVVEANMVSSLTLTETLTQTLPTGFTQQYNSGGLVGTSADTAFNAVDFVSLGSSVAFAATASNPSADKWCSAAVNLIPIPLGTIGSGFRAYRASTTQVAMGSGTNIFPASFLDTSSGANTLVTSDYTWVPSTQTLTVANAGHYHVVLTVGNVVLAAGKFTGVALYQNGVIARIGPTISNSTATTSASGFTVGMAWNLYLNAGDYIQPAFNSTGAAPTAAGDSTGSQTHFEVTLANRGLLS